MLSLYCIQRTMLCALINVSIQVPTNFHGALSQVVS